MNTLLINFVAYYATQVRSALGDLPQEAVEDLTDGLEADLIDAMQDSRGDAPASDLVLEDLIIRFGKPQEYAVELRSAAGFPPGIEGAADGGKSTVVSRLGQWAKEELSDAIERVKVMRGLPGLANFFVSLRPVWWIWRALILYVALFTVFGTHTNHPLPETFGAYVFLILLVVASVRFGQRAAAGIQARREAVVLRIANVVLIVLLLPTTATVSGAYSPLDSGGYDRSYNAGFNDANEIAGIRQGEVAEVPGASIAIDGEQVTNLFVYDADGNPVPQAQVVNQDGLPLSFSARTAQFNEATGQVQIWVGTADAYGRELGNVFPKTIWTLGQDAEYCSTEDEQKWAEIRVGEFYFEENKLFTHSSDEPLASIVGAISEDGENNRLISFTGGSFTNGQDCVMGVRIPTDAVASQVFPAERIAPLFQEEADSGTAPDESPEDKEQSKSD